MVSLDCTARCVLGEEALQKRERREVVHIWSVELCKNYTLESITYYHKESERWSVCVEWWRSMEGRKARSMVFCEYGYGAVERERA